MPYHDTGLHEDWFHGAPMLTWAQLAQQQQPPAAADDAAAAPPVRPRTLQQVRASVRACVWVGPGVNVGARSLLGRPPNGTCNLE